MRKTILDIPKYKELYTIIGNEIGTSWSTTPTKYMSNNKNTIV